MSEPVDPRCTCDLQTRAFGWHGWQCPLSHADPVELARQDARAFGSGFVMYTRSGAEYYVPSQAVIIDASRMPPQLTRAYIEAARESVCSCEVPVVSSRDGAACCGKCGKSLRNWRGKQQSVPYDPGPPPPIKIGDHVSLDRYRERGEHGGWIVTWIRIHRKPGECDFYELRHPNGGMTSATRNEISLA